jgi:hypothetical protein
VPHLLDVEVISALRKLARVGVSIRTAAMSFLAGSRRCPPITCDEKLAKGYRARVVLFAS